MDIFDSFIVNKYIAHKGYHNKDLPENSLGAFENAILNSYAIELDVQMISDGTIVVFHDETLSRMTGKDGYLSNLKKEDLKNYKLKSTKYHIPTLKETLDLVAGKTPILIEIKNSNFKIGKVEEKIISLLKDYQGEFAIMSFNPFTIAWLKQNAPDIMRGQLGGYLKNEKLSVVKKFALKHMLFNKKSEPHFICYEIDHLNCRYVKKYKYLPLLGFTAQNEDDFYKAIKKCDNIIFENFDIKKMI